MYGHVQVTEPGCELFLYHIAIVVRVFHLLLLRNFNLNVGKTVIA